MSLPSWPEILINIAKAYWFTIMLFIILLAIFVILRNEQIKNIHLRDDYTISQFNLEQTRQQLWQCREINGQLRRGEID